MTSFGENCLIDSRTDDDGETTVIILKGDKHVTLSLMTFVMLRSKFDVIGEFVDDLRDQFYTKYKDHIGRGFYVTVDNSAYCVDIRRFWRSSNDDIQPTNDAVSLTPEDFDALRLVVLQFNLPNIEHCSDTHYNQLSFLCCYECNPFDCWNY
jgi:hypothetical protein